MDDFKLSRQYPKITGVGTDQQQEHEVGPATGSTEGDEGCTLGNDMGLNPDNNTNAESTTNTTNMDNIALTNDKNTNNLAKNVRKHDARIQNSYHQLTAGA